jgi:hypothetical protein
MSGWTLLLLFCSFLIFYNLCLIVLVFFRFLLEAKMWGVGAEHGGILQTDGVLLLGALLRRV